MEEEWRVFLSENAPGLYEEMLSSVKHAAKWRDDEITRLRSELEVVHAISNHMKSKLTRISTICTPVQISAFRILKEVLDICLEQSPDEKEGRE